MNYINEHRRNFIETFPTSVRDIKESDIITFLYDGVQRWAMVLNPRYLNKTHALALEMVPRTMIIRLIQYVGGDVPPKLVYSMYLARQPALQELDAYRTFDIPKMNDVRVIIYDYGFNAANPHTIMSWDKAIVLGMGSDGEVYAEAYKPVMRYVNHKSHEEGVFIPFPMMDSTLRFLQQINHPKFVTTWKVPSTPEASEEETRNNQLLHYDAIVLRGGVLIISDNDIDMLVSENKRLVSL